MLFPENKWVKFFRFKIIVQKLQYMGIRTSCKANDRLRTDMDFDFTYHFWGLLTCPAPGEDFFIALFLKIGKLGGSSSLLWEPKA